MMGLMGHDPKPTPPYFSLLLFVESPLLLNELLGLYILYSMTDG